MKLFQPTTYSSRRKALMETMGTGLLFFPGATEQPFNYKSNTYPFRQDSNFLYYFGHAYPGLSGIIDVDAGISILVGDDADMEEVVWMGSQPSMQERIEKIGVEKSISAKELVGYISGKDVKYLPPYHADRTLFLKDLLGKTVEEVQNGFSPDLVKAVINQRAYKSEEEIEQMEDALAITAAMHDQLRKSIVPGKYEAQMRGLAEGIAFAAGGRLSYQAICTVQGQTLHNNAYHRRMNAGDMLLCDIGAENEMGYAGDITRTYSVSPTFSTQQAEIYDLVLKAEVDSIKAVRPRVTYRDIHLGAAKIITQGLQELGLMQGDADEAVAAGAHALFFPHGLGHMIGLDVHDMEGLGENNVGYSDTIKRSDQFGTAYLRMARELEPGFVITVEPGIYFIPELIDHWQKQGRFTEFINYDKVQAYRNFTGIRIEDNVLVTENGNKILGPPIAKFRNDIERE